METKKYIIEIPDNTAWIQWVKVSDKDGHACFDFKDPEDLIPYTEPDLEQVRKEAYEEGYKLGYYSDGYQRGLKDAWDAARKIVLSREDGGLFDYEERKAVFGCGNYMVLKEFFVSEVIEKIRQYEQKQKEIKIGDEVEGDEGGQRGVVIDSRFENSQVVVLTGNSKVYAWWSKCAIHKTGRHFPEIAEVLKKMQEKES